MREPPCAGLVLAAVCVATALGASPSTGQELRGWIAGDLGPGYLTNGFLEPAFSGWTPGLDSGFGTLGATGALEWSASATTVSLVGRARWMAVAESSTTWSSYLGRASLRQGLAEPLALEVEGALSEVRETTDRRTLWARTLLAWTVSPRVRLRVGPAVAQRRFPGLERSFDPGDAPAPPGTPGPPSAASVVGPIPGATARVNGTGDVTAVATSRLLSLELEAWPGSRWRVDGRLHGGHTDSDDLAVDYVGGGGSVRLTRWVGSDASLSVGGGLEGFGYRAAVESGDSTPEVPEDDLLWHAEASASWPLGTGIELRGRVAGVGDARSSAGADVLASVGLRVATGGRLGSAGERAARIWSPVPEGVRLSIPYRGEGRLHLTGDFNDWADPGLELRSAGGGVRTTTLGLEPGVYRYRIRVVEGDEERWLELPEGVPVEEDGFGGTNGVLVVPARDRRDANGSEEE